MKKYVFLSALTFLTLASCKCSQKLGTVAADSSPFFSDPAIASGLNDSIRGILTAPDKVTITRLKLDVDTLKPGEPRALNAQERYLIDFLMSNPENYASNEPVYGMFIPQVEVTYSAGGAAVNLQYDLGLKKWGIFTADAPFIAFHDIPGTDMARAFNLICPNDTLLQSYLPQASK